MMKYLEKNPMIMIVIGILGISMSAILVRFSDAPSSVTAAYRLLWTVLFMSPVMLGRSAQRRELLQTDRRTVFISALSGVFLAIHFTLWFESLYHTTVASSTAIVCTEVIWVALGYCLFMKGRLSAKEIAAILLTMAGSLVIAWSDSETGGSGHLYGDVLSLAAAVAVAVYMLLGRAARARVSTGVYTYIVYLFSAGTLLLIALFQGASLTAYGWNPVIVGMLLAIFSTLLGHSIFSWCLKFFSPAFVSATKLCEPVVASVIALFLFGEVPDIKQVLGGAVIICGVLYYSKLERERENGQG